MRGGRDAAHLVLGDTRAIDLKHERTQRALQRTWMYASNSPFASSLPSQRGRTCARLTACWAVTESAQEWHRTNWETRVGPGVIIAGRPACTGTARRTPLPRAMDEADDLDASASRALSLAAETAERRARLATLRADLAVSSPAAPPRPSKSKGKASAGAASTKAASAPRVKLVKPSRGPVEAPALDRTASGTDRAADDEASSIAFMQTVLPQHTVRDLEQALRASGGDPVVCPRPHCPG